MQSKQQKPWVLPVMPTKRAAQVGMSMIEYSLIGAGVVAFSLIAILASGSNLNDLFHALKTDVQGQMVTSNQAIAAHEAALSSFKSKSAP